MSFLGLIAGFMLISIPPAKASDFTSCLSNPQLQAQRSHELQKLYNEDQSDYRKELENHSDQPIDVKKLKRMGLSDLKRRERVGAIFGEGCFQSAADYSAAAMIYQHGDVADHFFQAFIWSKEAVKLGNTDEKTIVAMTLDRYLVRIGQKQLFGSQASKANLNSNCWCLEPVEESFPDSMREDYRGKDLTSSLAWLKKLNGANDCHQTYCATDLKPSPEGTVVGFW